MSNRWLFFPTPSGGTLVTKFKLVSEVASGSGSTFATDSSNYVLSGTDDVANNYQRYPSGDIRKSAQYIEFLIKIQSSSPDYSGAAAWDAARISSGFTLANCSLTIGGTTLNPLVAVSSYIYGPRIRYDAGSRSAATAYFNNVSVGDSIVVIADWT